MIPKKYLNEIKNNLKNYETTQAFLFIKLSNFALNEEKLANAVYKQIGDIALSLYYLVGQPSENGVASMLITKDMIEHWGIGEDTVIYNAMLNTLNLFPPRSILIEKLLYNPEYQGDDFMTSGFSERKNRYRSGFAVSNTLKLNGAATIFLPGVAKRLADLLGCNFYVVFTSIHEAMVHCEGTVDPEMIRDCAVETAYSVGDKHEFLSIYAFYYDAVTDSFTIAV